MESMPDTYASEEALEAKYDPSGEETDEVSSTEFPPQTSPLDSEEFERRVSRLCEMMNEDPSVRDRLIAEIYVNMASAEMGIRGMFELVQTQGMTGLMRGAFKRG